MAPRDKARAMRAALEQADIRYSAFFPDVDDAYDHFERLGVHGIVGEWLPTEHVRGMSLHDALKNADDPNREVAFAEMLNRLRPSCADWFVDETAGLLSELVMSDALTPLELGALAYHAEQIRRKSSDCEHLRYEVRLKAGTGVPDAAETETERYLPPLTRDEERDAYADQRFDSFRDEQ